MFLIVELVSNKPVLSRVKTRCQGEEIRESLGGEDRLNGENNGAILAGFGQVTIGFQQVVSIAVHPSNYQR